MKISTAFFALIPLVRVAAVPSSNNVVAPAPDVGNVYGTLCSERNFEGTCIVDHVTIGQCTSLSGAFTAQSFGPDAGLTCFVFDQVNCAGRSVGPITSGQVNPIPVGFKIASFRRTLIWFEGAPKQFYVKCENGAQYPAPELSHICRGRRNLKLQRFWEPAINSKLNLKRQDIRLLISTPSQIKPSRPKKNLESGAAAVTGGTQNEVVLVGIRPEAGDAVVEGRAEVDALAAAAVEGRATSREAGVDANEANSDGERLLVSYGSVLVSYGSVLKHSLGCSGVGFTCGDGVIMVLTKKVDYQSEAVAPRNVIGLEFFAKPDQNE
ncbi:hypothetical protein C8J57DRAFT_1579615 [Mycena rebaudengoi]|nr:hypothetical protein C8J57DRAFT_1579615 [Mycena rebaudengoi]